MRVTRRISPRAAAFRVGGRRQGLVTCPNGPVPRCEWSSFMNLYRTRFSWEGPQPNYRVATRAVEYLCSLSATPSWRVTIRHREQHRWRLYTAAKKSAGGETVHLSVSEVFSRAAWLKKMITSLARLKRWWASIERHLCIAVSHSVSSPGMCCRTGTGSSQSLFRIRIAPLGPANGNIPVIMR